MLSGRRARVWASVLGVAVLGGVMVLSPLGRWGGAALAADEDDGGFRVDRVHSFVLFKIKHIGVSYAYGRFNTMSGSFSIDPDDPEGSFINMTIDVSSVDTGNDGRDKHLRSADFFNVGAFPEATFESLSIAERGAGLEVTGNFTLHGETKRITVPLEFVGQAESRRGEKAGFHCQFAISRADFGVGGPGGLGDDVVVTVAFEGGR